MRILLFLLASGAIGAQQFGGSPPWGPEKPSAFKGQVTHGQSYEEPAGDGIRVKLVPDDFGWTIEIGGPRDHSQCVTPPLHGATARDITVSNVVVGEKRWINFALTDEDYQRECDFLNAGDLEHWGEHSLGRCWVQITNLKLSPGPPPEQFIESLAFNGECAPHAGLELWRLPALYVLPDNFSGWVTVYYGEKGKPALPASGNGYLATIGRSPILFTSSELRTDMLGAAFRTRSGKDIASRILGWQTVVNGCHAAETFFVGTQAQLDKSPDNPAFNQPGLPCPH